jgi:hypothetical protein
LCREQRPSNFLDRIFKAVRSFRRPFQGRPSSRS